MGVSVEGIRINPFRETHTVVVTSSPLKINLCARAGIPTEPDPRKVQSVGQGEEWHKFTNGHGVVVRSRVTDVPNPVSAALAKATELARTFSPNGHNHGVMDSTWEILARDQDHVFSFNKTEGDEVKIAEALQALYRLQGCRISSDTGVAVLSPDLKGVRLYQTSLMIGRVGCDLDMALVERVVRDNPQNSGGFSLFEGVRAGIIEPDPICHFRVREIDGKGAPLQSGSLMRFDAIMHELSTGPENNQNLLSLALGIPPGSR